MSEFDLIYCTNGDRPPAFKFERFLVRGQEEPLDGWNMFAAIIERSPYNGMVPIPLFSKGLPEVKTETIRNAPGITTLPEGTVTRHSGYYPQSIADGLVQLTRGMESHVDIREDRSAWVYVGAHEFVPAAVFKNIIPVEQDKRLILARSPNNTVSLDALAEVEMREPEKPQSSMKTYKVVHANLEELKKDRRFAVNDGYHVFSPLR